MCMLLSTITSTAAHYLHIEMLMHKKVKWKFNYLYSITLCLHRAVNWNGDQSASQISGTGIPAPHPSKLRNLSQPVEQVLE